jgi:hypothetical protein
MWETIQKQIHTGTDEISNIRQRKRCSGISSRLTTGIIGVMDTKAMQMACSIAISFVVMGSS